MRRCERRDLVVREKVPIRLDRCDLRGKGKTVNCEESRARESSELSRARLSSQFAYGIFMRTK